MNICVNVFPGEKEKEILGYVTESLEKNLTESGVECRFGENRSENDFRVLVDLGYSHNNNSRGVEILFGKQKLQNERLAKYVLYGICSNTGLMNRGIKEGSLDWDIFIKCGYITNPSDMELFKNDKAKHGIVLGIVVGIKEYLLFSTTRNDKI